MAKKDKGALGVLIGIGPKKGAPDGDAEGESGGYDADLETAAQDLIDAVGSGDAAAVAEAFKTMHMLCAGE